MTEPPPVLRVAIVDDEPLARDALRLLLADDPEVQVVGEAGDGDAAVALIAAQAPDLVFLDVQMPGRNGFDVLAALPAAPPALVFVTAYEEHALRAFEVHAVDYLLKPFDDKRFREALRRAKEAARLAKVPAMPERLIALMTDYERAAPATRGLRRVVVRSAGRVVFLDTAEIDWIEAADYYVQIHVGKQSYLHRQSMQSLEEQLDPQRFLRIHRSAIVNVGRVRELRRKGRRELLAILDGGQALKVGRSHREKLSRLMAPG
jgi:two-component system LytT family response regulator